MSEVANRVFPPSALKIQGRLDVHVPAAAGEQKILLDGGNGFDAAAKVAHEQDVAIGVTENVARGELLRLVEDAGEVFCAVTVAANFENVADAQFVAYCGGAFFVAKENDFDIGMETFPALQGVALDDGDVSDERLGRGEESQHASLLYWQAAKSERGCICRVIHRVAQLCERTFPPAQIGLVTYFAGASVASKISVGQSVSN